MRARCSGQKSASGKIFNKRDVVFVISPVSDYRVKEKYDVRVGRASGRLLYNYFRDYDPSLGRYIQSDPIGILKDFSSPQLQVAIQAGIPLLPQSSGLESGLNRLYSYVDQNPLNSIDPFGLVDPTDHLVYDSGTNNPCVSDCIREEIKQCAPTLSPNVAGTVYDSLSGLLCSIVVRYRCAKKGCDDCSDNG